MPEPNFRSCKNERRKKCQRKMNHNHDGSRKKAHMIAVLGPGLLAQKEIMSLMESFRCLAMLYTPLSLANSGATTSA
jgi:hypothetical protein